jgi:hypothetical protein
MSMGYPSQIEWNGSFLQIGGLRNPEASDQKQKPLDDLITACQRTGPGEQLAAQTTC